jgi:hypothetical protein
MYGWLWRHLPGPVPVRVAILVVAAAVVLAACFTWAFPAISPLMPFSNTTVGN